MNKTSPHPPTPEMPPSSQSITVENVDQITKPIAAIIEIVKSNTPKHQPSYMEDLPNVSSPCVSPAKKRQKIIDHNFPEISQTDITKMLMDSISKFIGALYFKKLFLFQKN